MKYGGFKNPSYQKHLQEYNAVKHNVDSILSPAQQREQEKIL